MTETEWLTGTDPQPMLLELLSREVSGRKGRLFGCGYLRHTWQRLDGKEGSREAVVVAERFADGLASRADLAAARRTAEATAEYWSCRALGEPVWQAVSTVADDDLDFLEMLRYETEDDLIDPVPVVIRERRAARLALYCDLLRCVWETRSAVRA